MNTLHNEYAPPGMRWKVKNARTRKTLACFQTIEAADQFQVECSNKGLSTVIRKETL